MVNYIDKPKLRIKKGYTMKLYIKWELGVRTRKWREENERRDKGTWNRNLEKRELSYKTKCKVPVEF